MSKQPQIKFWQVEFGQSFLLDGDEYVKTGDESAVLKYPPFKGVTVNNDDLVELLDIE